MDLTEDQNKAFIEIQQFIKGGEVSHALVGCAGTGKTTLTKELFKWATQKNMAVLGVAPTHKARRVLENTINKTMFLHIQTTTVAALLQKTKKHSYVGTSNYSKPKTRRFNYDLLIIDECSMISDSDVQYILRYGEDSNTKILFIGDNAQIPNPSQRYSRNGDGTISKKDSSSFDQPTSKLTTIIRQDVENPLREIYDLFRQDLYAEPDIKRETKIVDDMGVIFEDDLKLFATKIKEKFTEFKNANNIENVKIIAYTNDRVKKYNTYVRKHLGYSNIFELGELLMGYQNVGYPYHIIENGQDYMIKNIQYTSTHCILEFSKLQGWILNIQEVNNTASKFIFVLDVTSENNNPILEKLVKLAIRVNKNRSTIEDYKEYMKYKNQIIFIENIYKYNGKFYSETQLRRSSPLLFKHTHLCINDSEGELSIKDNEVTKKITAQYPDILSDRIKDDKSMSTNEKLIDRFQIIEKDLDYGYAITAHKSQGSTYHTVFIDEDDFKKMSNRWNHAYNAYENSTKEKNQLKYVAYTRPTNMAISYYTF